MFGLKTKRENIELRDQIESLKKTISDAGGAELLSFQEQITNAQSEYENMKTSCEKLQNEFQTLSRTIEEKKKEIVELDETILLQDFALYTPKYSFENSTQYKNRLDQIRDDQKLMIKSGTAATGNTNWTVNNKVSEGKKMVRDTIKLVLRSFNNECDTCVSMVKFNNIESCEKRINKAYDAVNKLGKIMAITINPRYLHLKLQELYLAHEYQVKKQEEKEEQRMLREQMREEARLQKEIDEARKDIEKEKKHYANALSKLEKQLLQCDNEIDRSAIEDKIRDVKTRFDEIEEKLKDIDYRAANKRAGYVYVISNIGAFGENVYKIGMTRRLVPEERVHELGDASVPFKFDIHAMIFSDDAPSLENALHKAFDNKKLNMVNTRREFFSVTLEEIEAVVKQHHDKSVEFVKTAEADQYRESLKIRAMS